MFWYAEEWREDITPPSLLVTSIFLRLEQATMIGAVAHRHAGIKMVQGKPRDGLPVIVISITYIFKLERILAGTGLRRPCQSAARNA